MYNQIIKKIACWIGYGLFAGWSAVMTAESISMSMNLRPVWVVFIFVFIVALVAGFCLSGMVEEIKNTVNPNKSKFVLCLLGFLLFWGFSFATNVHYSLMRNDGLEVVKAELGNYRSYVEDASLNNKQKINEDTNTIFTSNSQENHSYLLSNYTGAISSSRVEKKWFGG